MINKTFPWVAALLISCTAPKTVQQNNSPENDVERILKTLTADDMQGRAAFTPGADKAAAFMESEFIKYGLEAGGDNAGFRQQFSSVRVRNTSAAVTIDGRPIPAENIVVLADSAAFSWNSDVDVLPIKPGDNMFQIYNELEKTDANTLVLVDTSFAERFRMLKEYLAKGRVVDAPKPGRNVVFVLGTSEPKNFMVTVTNLVETRPLFNVIGKIPGKSRANEIVIFSAHYDHVGILPPVDGDSVANGADDDASGVTAVLALAKYYKEQNNNERTLLFVTFTAEELGLVGSKYFSSKMNPEDVVAMFNIEMIGKEAKFGKNTAFITGFDRTDFGKILQNNLQGTQFTFHPDPYPDLNLFFRSDNASLAEKGVPAHTISTDQIDKDQLYHTVNDEFETLDVENVKSTIRAIALSSTGIVSGKDTPSRVTN